MVDVSFVFYRPDSELISRALGSVSSVKSVIRKIWILLSGSDSDFSALCDLIENFDLIDKVVVIHRYDNLGFSSGHNLILEKSFGSGADCCFILNPDIEFDPVALTDFLKIFRSSCEVALFGPKLIRIDSSEARNLNSGKYVDSMGIGWSFSSRHYDIDQGCLSKSGRGTITRRDGISGACLLVSNSAYFEIVSKSGYFFDDAFLAYREDAELGIRASLFGVKSFVVDVDGFYHVRSVRGFKRGKVLPDLLGVRNRFLLKWRLGKNRPGFRLIALARDIVVFCAVISFERSSIPGLIQALKIRRFIRSTSPLRFKNEEN